MYVTSLFTDLLAHPGAEPRLPPPVFGALTETQPSPSPLPPPPRFVPPCLSLQPLPPDPDLDPDLDLDLDLVSLARDLERFSTHESIRAILDQGADAADTTREIEQHLHEAEMTMVDQYIAAAGDLEDLHGQVTYADDGLGQTLTP